MRFLGGWKRILGWTLGAMGVLALAGWSAVGYASTKDIEEPAYTVAAEKDGYEIREYAGYIRGEVTLEGKYRETLYDGFRNVADYIFGNNTARGEIAMTAPVMQETASQKIAMTAPVLQDQQGDGRYTVAFVMPSSFTMETLPRPNNPAVTLREVPRQRFAVLKFGWYATEDRAAKKIEKLKGHLTRDGLVAAGEPIVAQYDPPWTPPFMRRNEIHIPLP